MGNQHVDDECHVQAENVGLEFLGEGSATLIIGGKLAAVDGYS